MKVERDHPYPHAPEAVYALFTDAEEVHAKQEAIGAREICIEECERDDEGADVAFVRQLPADVPGILKKFLQPWNTVRQSEQWRVGDDDVLRADLEIEIAGVPVTVTGTLELEPTDDGCVNHVRMDVDSGIPFVGKTLAEFVAKDCKRILRDEFEYITDRLG